MFSCSGTTLTIEATGIVKETIEDGAYVDLEVKYGYIRLINTRADLCNEVKNVDLECPIEKGKIAIVKQVDLPKEIPPVRIVTPNICPSVRCVHGGLEFADRMRRASTMSRRTSSPRRVSTSPA